MVEKEFLSQNRTTNGYRRARLSVLALLLFIAACGESIDPQAALERGRQLFAEENYNEALIELKNAVQGLPDNGDARLLLGKAYLESGDPASAAKELKRARTLGQSSDELNLAVARALIEMSSVDEAATEIALNSRDSSIEWVHLQGNLDLRVGRFEEARDAFIKVIEAEPDNAEARLFLARASIGLNDIDTAREQIASALEITQSDFLTWMLKGDLERHDKDFQSARDAYSKAIEIKPKDVNARLARATVRAAMLDNDGAVEDLNALGKQVETDPRALYIRAVVSRQKNEHDDALRYLSQVLQVYPNHRESLAQTAAIHFAENRISKAQEYLDRLLEIDPGNARFLKMQQAIDLRTGKLDSNVADFESDQVQSIDDPNILSLLGTTYLKHGKVDESRKSLEKALELDPDSARLKSQLALLKLRTGELDDAMADLKAVRTQEPTFLLAQILEVFGEYAGGRREAAESLADTLVSSNPDEPIAYNVRGYFHGLAGETDAARESFNTALDKDASFNPANFNLARMAIAEKDFSTARAHLTKILDNDPANVSALLVSAALYEQDGEEERAMELRQTAYAENPDDPQPRIVLARVYRMKDDVDNASAMAEEAYRLASYSAGAQYEYVLAKLATGDSAEALNVAKKMGERYPNVQRVQELLAHSYRHNGDTEKFEAMLQDIADRYPDAMASRSWLVRLALSRNEYDQAHKIARSMIAIDPQRGLGHGLQGDIYMRQGIPAKAFTSYEARQNVDPSSDNIIQMYRAARASGKDLGFVDEWLEAHPDDTVVRTVRATDQVGTGSNDDAIAQYRTVLEKDPDNIVALNNLAWLYDQKDDPAAIDYARKAYEISPTRPEIMDTYGWISLRRGNTEQAVNLLYRAVEGAPENRDIRYHLAAALSETNDKRGARAELEKILGDENAFESRAKAEALLHEINQ